MNQYKSWGIVFVFLFILAASVADTQSPQISVYLVGDSTMSEKQVRDYPETGWGTPFANYFNESVSVENHARNGRSTRTFLEEGRWEPIVEQLSEGDYVFIQFGHNDEVPSKEQSTTPDQFQANLEKYVSETTAQGATPILLTSIARRKFDDEGIPVDTHREYADLTREVADETGVVFFDMDKTSRRHLSELGPEQSKFLYLHLKPGQNPNYPEGIEDDTHFNELGARRMAEMVLQGIREQNLDLADGIVTH